jgi:signal transduction histidine kinase
MTAGGGWPLLGAVGFGTRSGGGLLTSEDEAVMLPAAELLAMALENRLLSRRIVDQQRLAAIGQLAAGVAHEINTPLTGISSYTQMLLEDEDGGPGIGSASDHDHRADLIRRIGLQADRAGRIVSSLLNFARQGGGDLQPVDLAAVIREAVALFEHRLMRSGVRLGLDLGETELPVLADPHQLQQVVLNLMDNAMEAMSEGGSLDVTARADGKRCLFTVSDTGEGIPASHRERIFDPFFTTRPAGSGTGLGLSICYGIIRRHKGLIEFESEPGRGTTFTVTLPIHGAGTHDLRQEVDGDAGP